jgi:glycosyltransferase involved in cell wall biosynthesis
VRVLETLRVILVSDWFLPRKGGVETAIYNLARSLLEKGHDPIVLTHQTHLQPSPPIVDETLGFPVVRLKVPLNGDDYTTSYKSALLVFDFIKHNAPDIIHGHSLLSPFALLAIHGGKGILGVPTVLTHHSLVYEELSFRQLKMARYALSRVDVATAVSKIVMEDLQKIIGGKRGVMVTPNCIRLNEWTRTESNYEGDPVVSFISRLTERKNPLLALEAFEEIRKEHPKAKLYIAGWGPLKDRLLKEISSRGLEKNVKYLGPLEREEVRSLLSSTDLFLMPGKKEAFSIATLEALALGVPVVGFRETGLEDMVKHGYNGFLASSDYEFKEFSLKLAGDESLRRTMSLKAVETSKRFDCNVVVNSYLEAYKKAFESCTREKRLLLYKIYRVLRGDPVKPGEWCDGRKAAYHKVPPKRSGVPHIRR